MEVGAITQHVDVAQVVLYVFWLFFAGLIIYLQREARREGYPLLRGPHGSEKPVDMFMPQPKTFRTISGRTVTAPNPATADTRPLKARQTAGGPGSPFIPTGNPLADCIGPSSYAERPDIPDITFEKKPRIVPLRIASDFTIADGDPDPRGMPVLGADGKPAGKIVEAWVDRSEYILRYLELEVAGAASKRVLLPINFAEIDKANKKVMVGAILAAQFAGVPTLKSPDQITFLEEEKVTAYYGGGLLYATPERQEPVL
jgi:photosynthetic reaction center H subunit